MVGGRNATYPVVVVVGQVQLAKVDGAKRIGVADEVALPVVVEVVPGNGDPVAATNGVELTIVVVGTKLLRELRFEFIVVDPDASAVLDSDAVVVDDEANGEVANDDVGRIDDSDAVLADLSRVAHTEDGLVAADAKARGQVDAALNVDGARCRAIDGSNQSSAISDCNLLTLLSTSSLADWVVLRVAHEIEATELARGVLLLTRSFGLREGESGCQSQTAEENGGDLHDGECLSRRDRGRATGKDRVKTLTLYAWSGEPRSIFLVPIDRPLIDCMQPLDRSEVVLFQDGEMY